MRAGSPILLLGLAVVAVGCGGSLPDERPPIASLPQQRLPLEKEWRDARRVPPRDGTAVDVGIAPDESVLRFGICAVSLESGDGSVSVFADEQRIETFGVSDAERWFDVHLDVSDYAGANIALAFDGLDGAWLGPCELAGGDSDTPNVLVVLIDTLRKDHLGCYGYERETSPHMDALADDGVLVSEMVPQSSWTRPSVASILTSTYPNVHGADDWPNVMRDGLPTLAEALERAGYETHALMGNPQVLPVWGMGEEFARCVDVNATLDGGNDDGELVDAAIETIDFAKGRPWFVYLHLLGPHEPYEPPAAFAERFEREHDAHPERGRAVDLYDGEIAYTDEQIGRLIAHLRETGLYDDALIVVTSDHGEEFWDHGGEKHGHTLYEELLDVPLIVKLPDSALAGTRRDGIVEGIDLAPTLVDLIGATPDKRFQGRSFARWLREGGTRDAMGYASLRYAAHSMDSAKRDAAKYIVDRVAGDELWFDLAADPREQSPLPAPLDAELAHHASRIASQGATGLHVLVTCGEADREVTGTIRAANMGTAELRYYDSKYTLEQSDGAIAFRIQTHDAMDAQQRRDVWHTEYAEQAHAHLYVPLPAEERMQLELTLDGEPFPEAHLTAPGEALTLAGEPIALASLLAEPNAYDPAALPRGFGVYVWAVAGADALGKEDLDPDVVKALESLGYLE